MRRALFILITIFSLLVYRVGATNNTHDTLLIYMLGNHQTELSMSMTQNQLEREGVPYFLNVFMCLNPTLGTTQAKTSKAAVLAQVRAHTTVTLERLASDAAPTAAKNILLRACLTALNKSGKGNFSLIVWDQTPKELKKFSLTDTDVQQVCAEIKKRLGKNIQLLGFDGGCMARAELAYAVKESVDYLLASQESPSAFGWPYHLMLQAYKKFPAHIQERVKLFLQHYKSYYEFITQKYSLSCINLHQMKRVFENIQEVSGELRNLTLLQKSKKLPASFRTAYSTVKRPFADRALVDLYDWYKQMLDIPVEKVSPRLKGLLVRGMTLIQPALLGSAKGTLLRDTHGISLYLPERAIHPAYVNSVWAQNNTAWVEFLQAVL